MKYLMNLFYSRSKNHVISKMLMRETSNIHHCSVFKIVILHTRKKTCTHTHLRTILIKIRCALTAFTILDNH